MNNAPIGWETQSLSEIVHPEKPIVYGIVQAGPEHPGGVPYIKSSDVGGRIEASKLSCTAPEIAARFKRSIVRPGDVVFSLRGNIGELSIVPENLKEANLTQGTARISVNAKAQNEFVAYALRAPMLQRKIATVGKGSTFKEISIEALRELEIQLPPLPEQRKVVEVLCTWDKAIDKLDSLLHELERLNTALCQKLFEKQFTREESLVKASRIFEPVSERARPDLPLLAVMQDLGVVRRDELERRVAMPDGDISSYKVVRPGDFVISLRSFEGGLEYSNVLGLVSPAYTVLRPIREINGDYYRHFFKSRSFIGRLDKLIFGIRDGKQIAFRDFGDMRIPNPRIKVQESDATALNLVASLLEINQKRKQSLEKQKRGLMQKLLTGQWRVKA